MKLVKRGILEPALMVSSLQEIDFTLLWTKGKRGIILDLDNTISPWRKDTLTREAELFIEETLQLNYKLCLLSNASHSRTEKIARQYKIFYIAPAFKPLKRAFKLAQNTLQLNKEEIIVVGDQLFTDVLGGNRSGFYTILVPPLDTNEFIWTKMMRLIENWFVRRN